MFTVNSIKGMMAIAMLVMVVALLPGTALAAGGDDDLPVEGTTGEVKVDSDANLFTSELDHLREIGQAAAQAALIRRTQVAAVLDYSSELDHLRQQTFLASQRPVIASAYDYTTHLEHLRPISRSSQSDTAGYITVLDQLRVAGQTAALNASQVATR